MATVLSGTSGALYYKPAGTTATFAEAAVDTTDDEITVASFLNFKAGDPVQFSVVNTETGATGSGTLPAGLTASTTFYVLTYVAATGVMTVSATLGGSKLDITDDGTAVTPNAFQVAYADFAAVGDVREWSFEITREEIDVTAIGQAAGQFAPFRRYITGFADGEGSAMVYLTDDDSNLANRIVQDVIQRQQAGAAFKLYIDRVLSAGVPSGNLSRSIEFQAVLTSASLTVNPDDAQMVEIAFRPAAAPVFDFSKSA
jgi:hypothetical protein